MPLPYATVTPAGTGQTDAAGLYSRYTQATGDGTAGVRLPGCTPGAEFFVYNNHASLGLLIYPASGDDINDGTPDAAITIEGKTLAIIVGLDTSTWAAIYTANT